MKRNKKNKNRKADATVSLSELSKKFNLQQSIECSNIFSKIPLTYLYLEDFIKFAKNKDKNICLTAIPKSGILFFAEKDIEICLSKYGTDSSHTIYYAIPHFDKLYECPYGDTFKDVWLMFIAQNEDIIIEMLNRFNKLKVFI